MTGDIDLTGPFGTPDGSRADITTVLQDFVNLESQPGFGAVATRADDATVRVIVGKMGAGKTVYMRRLFSHFSDPDTHDPRARAVYADRPQQALPNTELIVRASDWFPAPYLTEKWMQLWGRATLRSLVTHMLCADPLRSHIDDEVADEIIGSYHHLIGRFRRPRSIYSELREILNEHNSGNHVTRYLENPDWEDLEDVVADVLRHCPPVFFYLDAVDDTFNHAPLHWLRCQEGLFLQVMQMLRDQKFGSRFHVVICIRDIVLSSIYQSEHAPRYHNEPHIRILDWSRDAIEFLLLEKLHRLPPTYLMAPEVNDCVTAWLGSRWIQNERRGVDEDVLDYIVRHTRLIPRDIISLGNDLAIEVLRHKALGHTELPPEAIRRVVSAAAKRFGDSQLAQCASQLAADLMPRHATAHGYASFYLQNPEYVLGLRESLKDVIGAVGVDRFTGAALKEMNEVGTDAFGGPTTMSSILWQNGLLGYVDRDETRFYSAPSNDSFAIPLGCREYVFHPCLLDSVRGMRSVGPPIRPYPTA